MPIKNKNLLSIFLRIRLSSSDVKDWSKAFLLSSSVPRSELLSPAEDNTVEFVIFSMAAVRTVSSSEESRKLRMQNPEEGDNS